MTSAPVVEEVMLRVEDRERGVGPRAISGRPHDELAVRAQRVEQQARVRAQPDVPARAHACRCRTARPRACVRQSKRRLRDFGSAACMHRWHGRMRPLCATSLKRLRSATEAQRSLRSKLVLCCAVAWCGARRCDDDGVWCGVWSGRPTCTACTACPSRRHTL